MKATHIVRCFQIAAIFIVAIHGQCPWQNGALPSIENGYRSNVDHLTLYKKGLAYGYYDVECEAGYELDSNIGGRITCLTLGSWSSPLPQCKTTGRCDIPILFDFLQTSPGIRFKNSNSFIYTDGIQDDQALGGSNITVYCAQGYQNTGGPLAIICTSTGSWTTFPKCLSTSTKKIVSRCPVTENTWTFDNGYLSDTDSIAIYSDNTAAGFVVVSCSNGYAIDSVSEGKYTCNGGVWSPRPYCIKTARCSLATLKSFLNDRTSTIGMKISSQRLLSTSESSDDILIDSYVLFQCSQGYKNTDNNLNVTCTNNGQWSSYPKCISTSTVAPTGRCPLSNGELPKIENGYRSNIDNIKVYSSGVAEGFYDVSCSSGYELDSSIGGRITCLTSNSWSSPLPQCKSTGRCDTPTLFNYLQSNSGIRFSQSDSFIYNDGDNKNQALGGSNITVQCAVGYKNIGGSFVIKCTATNSWTTFPNCVSTSTTAVPTTKAPRCPVTEDSWTFPNGYLSNTNSLSIYNDDTAVGFVIVSCSNGYDMDSVSAGKYECNNGIWSARPYCTKASRCSRATLKSYLNDPIASKGVEISSQKLSVETKDSDEILVGSYMALACRDGYIPSTNNNFNVTCNNNGQWSAFPSCTKLSTTTVA